MYIKLEMLGGICPESSLHYKSRDSNDVTLPIFLGIPPDWWFLDKFSNMMPCRFVSSSGISLQNELHDKWIPTKFGIIFSKCQSPFFQTSCSSWILIVQIASKSAACLVRELTLEELIWQIHEFQGLEHHQHSGSCSINFFWKRSGISKEVNVQNNSGMVPSRLLDKSWYEAL